MENTTTIAIFGHKKPDTDAIVSAIVMQDWLDQQHIKATAYRLDNPNSETQFLLNLVNISAPPSLPDLPQGQAIALVDHNESGQSIANLNDYQIQYVIDHHKLGDLTTSEPVYIRLQPVGSTCTLLFLMYQELALTPPKNLATLMCGAIISDTLNLHSPTATAQDRFALKQLSNIADIKDLDSFAKQLFEAKSSVAHLTDLELINSDFKKFSFNKDNSPLHIGISCIETVNPSQIFARKDALQQASIRLKTQSNLDYLLVIVVDILAQQSWIIASDDAQNAFMAQVFHSEMQDNLLSIGNKVSRKKQIVPALESFFAER